MKLDLHMFVAQWRRALLFIAAVLAMAAAITLQQSLDKNIFTAKVELSSAGLEELANKTETFVTSVAGEVKEKATSLLDDAGDAVEDGWREATAGIADIFKRDETALASGPTPRFLKLHHPIQDMPTPTPTPPVALHKRADSDEDEDDNTTEVTLEIKPHTTVDFDFEEVPILGDILSFIANLVITLTPLGLLYFLHVLLLVFFWVYFARLVFRVVAASPTPEGSKKSGKYDLLMKLLHYIPAFAAAEAIVTIIRVFFVPVVLATCFGLGLAVHWIDFKILDLVQGESYESFLDLVTVDFTKGAAPGMVQSAFVLVCIAIGLDLIEVLFSFLVEIRRLARLGSGGRSDSFYSAGESESKFEMRPHGVPISWPQPAHLSKA